MQVRTSVLEERKAMIDLQECVREECKRRDEKECANRVVYIGCVLDIALK